MYLGDHLNRWVFSIVHVILPRLALLELAKFGRIDELNVVENLGDHMFGNVYVKVILFLKFKFLWAKANTINCTYIF